MALGGTILMFPLITARKGAPGAPTNVPLDTPGPSWLRKKGVGTLETASLLSCPKLQQQDCLQGPPNPLIAWFAPLSPTFSLFTLIPSQVPNPHLITFFALVTILLCPYPNLLFPIWLFSISGAYAISSLHSIADIIPQILLLALLSLGPQKVPVQLPV